MNRMVTVRRFPGSDDSRASNVETFVDDEEQLDLAYLLGVLRRRKYLIAGIMFLVTSFTALFVTQITPLYRAETLLVLEENQQNVLNIDAVTQGLRTDYYTNETEAAVIGSRELAVKTVEMLNLVEDPLFNPYLEPPKPGLLDSIRNWLFEAGEEEDPWAGFSPEEKRELILEYTTDYYLAGLSVSPSFTSRIIAVGYASTNPRVAARLANTAAEIYILDQLETRGAATVRATDWLSERTDQLRRRVIESERRLDEFRRASGIVETGGRSVYQNQLADLSSELIIARTKRAEAEAQSKQIKKLLAASGSVESAAAVINSPLIQKLREQESQLLRKIAEYKTQLREGHPRMTLAANELEDLRKNIANEVNKIALNLGNELEIARVREANLEAEIASLQKKIEAQAEAETTINALESEVEANKQLYETILTRFQETKVQDDELIQANARIISRAVEPSSPYYPKKRLMVMAALFASMIGGIALAFVLEYLDSGFRTAEQLENVTGQPVLGLFPHLRDGESPYKAALERPNSIFGESVRRIRTSLALSSVQGMPKAIMVTSSVPGEGKTSGAVALAVSAARSGQKCVLIDCDLRHPSVHEALGMPNEQGLSNYLAGQMDLSGIMEMDVRSGLRVIPAGPSVPHPADLLGSQQMRNLTQQLGELFDFVILDAPPLLAVSDALILARNVDKTVFMVRWARTDRNTARAGLKQLLEAGTNLAGVVLSLVDVRKSAQYGFGGSSHYYEDYDRYYKEA
ncbi:MAG: polysaccharide biosynthesis tyrosine autokinase [Alphaproteobacteria bacterium]|nr:polysaccharide biosynthesis tyrosine autokinase [Alphaproteobacteria bacterium]